MVGGKTEGCITRTAATHELTRLIPDNMTLRMQIMNIFEQYAETAFKAVMQSKATDYENWASKKRKAKA